MESVQSKLQELGLVKGKESPGNADCPEYMALVKSNEALCSAFGMLLQALQPLAEGFVERCNSWQQAADEALLQQKASLRDLAKEDPRNWNKEDAEQQLFEFTGLVQDLDRVQQQHRQQQAETGRRRRRQQLANAAAVQRDFCRAMADALQEIVEIDAEQVGMTEVTPPLVNDLMDINDWGPTESPPLASASVPDLLDLSADSIDGIDVKPDESSSTVEVLPEDRAAVEEAVERWQEGKNLRALLASVHLVAQKNSAWTERSLSSLLDPAALKSAYREALLTFHPDKFLDQPVLGRCVVDALIKAHRSER